MKNIKKTARGARSLIGVLTGSLTFTCCTTAGAYIVDVYQDSLDKAVNPPMVLPTAIEPTDMLNITVGDTLNYDSNVFRLPSDVNVNTLPGVGSNPSRGDFANSATAAFDGQWLLGSRQQVNVDLRGDDNRYFRNDNLDNVSTADVVQWNWGLGPALSGQIGADYSRNLTSFVNTAVYSRNIIAISDEYAGGRYQVGPHWALFAGILGQQYSFSAPQTQSSDTHNKAVDVGGQYFTSALNSIGLDYRFTDSRAPHTIDLNNSTFEPDYREDRARVIVRYALSDKTQFDAYGGYLKREYTSNTIENYSGYIGRGTIDWLPREKLELQASVYRQLTSDLTNQTDYFTATGVVGSPIWRPSEKITLTVSAYYEHRDYLGSNAIATPSLGRVDSIVGQTAVLAYLPLTKLTVTVTLAHENRGSNFDIYKYDDLQSGVGVSYKFGSAPPGT